MWKVRIALFRPALTGLALFALANSGCDLGRPASPSVPLATIPLIAAPQGTPTATLSPNVAYMNSTRVEMTLYSTSFNVADTVTTAQPYDASMTPLTPWTIINQSIDTTGMTITVVFKTGDGKATGPAPGVTKKPAAVAPPLVSTTVTITTNNGVVAKIPLKPVTIDPCAS